MHRINDFFSDNDIADHRPIIRGGVEDTRLEAKDQKKNPRSRPRTDPLEAKTKDTSESVLKRNKKKKEKRSSKFFFRRSPKKEGHQKMFSGTPQNFNNLK